MKRFWLTLIALLGLTFPSLAADITYSEDDLFILGEIKYQDYFKFHEIIALHGDEITNVWLTSIGGSFIDGVMIGADINALGLTTIVVDHCFSACAYIWLAGGSRQVFEFDPEDITIIGIHMPGLTGQPVLPEWIIKKTKWYLSLIGMPEQAILDILATPNASTLFLSPKQMQEWGVAASRRPN